MKGLLLWFGLQVITISDASFSIFAFVTNHRRHHRQRRRQQQQPPSHHRRHQRQPYCLPTTIIGNSNNNHNDGLPILCMSGTATTINAYSSNNNHNRTSSTMSTSVLNSNNNCSTTKVLPAPTEQQQQQQQQQPNPTLGSSSDDGPTSACRSSERRPLSTVLPPLPVGYKRVYLIRHGETHWNTLGKIQGGGHDIPLNDNGRIQATKVARELDGIDLSVVASSNLSRAKETADILYARHCTNNGMKEPRNDNKDSGNRKGDDNHDNQLDDDDDDDCAASVAANISKSIIRIVDAGFNEMSFGEFEGLAHRDETLDPAIIERFRIIGKQVKDDPTIVFPGGGESTRQVEERAVGAMVKVLELVQDDDDANHIAVVSHGRTNKVLIAATALGDVKRLREVRQANTAINVLDFNIVTGEWVAQVINYIDHVEGHVIVRL